MHGLTNVKCYTEHILHCIRSIHVNTLQVSPGADLVHSLRTTGKWAVES